MNYSLHSKGESVLWPSKVVLPEIDFAAIAKKSNLQLDDHLCASIKCILREYISLVRAYEETPLSDERKSFLKAINNACELLESVFELDGDGTLEYYDPKLFFAWKVIAPHVECFLEERPEGETPHLVIEEPKFFDFSDRGNLPFNGKNVADYLVICRKRIQQELEVPTQSGNRKKYAIIRCLKGLHQVYSSAGGEGRGCWWYEGDQGEYRGPFFEFASGLLGYIDYPFKIKALGNQIIKNIKL